MRFRKSIRWGTFFSLLGMFLVLWLVVLPMTTEWPMVRARIERNERAGINPTALFYTEHASSREFLNRMEDRLQTRKVIDESAIPILGQEPGSADRLD